jgi:hypothetical protein
MLLCEVVDGKGHVAIAVAELVGLGPTVVDGQF